MSKSSNCPPLEPGIAVDSIKYLFGNVRLQRVCFVVCPAEGDDQFALVLNSFCMRDAQGREGFISGAKLPLARPL